MNSRTDSLSYDAQVDVKIYIYIYMCHVTSLTCTM